MSDFRKAAQQALENLPPQNNSPNFDITHAEGCWSWGPAHYECAISELRRKQRYCQRCNQQDMTRAKFDEESG